MPSRSLCPITSRIAVSAAWITAPCQFCTVVTTRVESLARNHNTALTLIGTPSRVTVSCVSSTLVTVRRSTRTTRSIHGISQYQPGPFASPSRPRRNITARSYSWFTPNDLNRVGRSTTSTKKRKMRPPVIIMPVTPVPVSMPGRLP